jgi:hypothetical protein
MRATTIRFTPELWDLLKREAEREEVSVAQYVRDAALFRVAYGAGVRREQELPDAGSELPRAASLR